jgi:hypothetical protein
MCFSVRMLPIVLTLCWPLLTLATLALASPSLAQGVVASDDARIAKLIKELGHEEFSVRESAQRELVKLGMPAEKALTAAAASNDVEISRRTTLILRALAQQKVAAEVDKITWIKVLDRVRQHAASKEWQKDGFADDVLEGALQKLVDQANAAVGETRVKLPTTFAECRPARGPAEGPAIPNQLYVVQGSLDLRQAQQSIILVDGSVNVSGATNCIIIARGAVNVSGSQGNVIIAGQHVSTCFEATHLKVARPAQERIGSLLMSGGTLQVSHPYLAVCYAREKFDFSRAENCFFLNGGPKDLRRMEGSAIVDAKLLFTPSARPNPLEGKLKVVQAHRASAERSLLILEKDGVEFALRPGSDIKDNLGKPIPELAGWKLDLMDQYLAVFSNGKEDACFQVPRN